MLTFKQFRQGRFWPLNFLKMLNCSGFIPWTWCRAFWEGSRTRIFPFPSSIQTSIPYNGQDNNYIQIDGMSRHQHEHVIIVFKFKCIALQKVERAALPGCNFPGTYMKINAARGSVLSILSLWMQMCSCAHHHIATGPTSNALVDKLNMIKAMLMHPHR